MKDNVTPWEIVEVGIKLLKSGNLVFMYSGLLVVLFCLMTVSSFYDGLNGRMCASKKFSISDPASWAIQPACFIRGFLEQTPRFDGANPRGR